MNTKYQYIHNKEKDFINFLCNGCSKYYASINQYTIALETWRKNGGGDLCIYLCQECSSDLMETILQNCRDTNRKEDVK
jgi:hypothetical protein